MKLTPLQKRAERKARNHNGLDMNLVALIDIFTILIFFLLSSAAGVEMLPSHKAVQLPQSLSQTLPHETLVVVVSANDILVDGRKVVSVADAMAAPGDVIAPLKAELEQHAARGVVREQNAAKGRALTILGDKGIPYVLLRKVMATAAQATYVDVSFAVTQRFAAS
jgi:biopolymer transport protein ExbD